MRPLKFRVWDNHFNKWVPFNDGIINSEYFTVHQFTGTQDRNGKDIFEGDIVKWTHFDTVRSGQIVYSTSEMGFICKEEYPYEASSGCMEVIGNIFENPELLKKNKK